MGGVLAFVVTGCGPSDSGSEGDGTGTGGAATGGSATGGAASGGSASGGAATGGSATGGSATATGDKTGLLTFVDFPTGLSFGVSFRDGIGDAPTAECTTVTTEHCSVSTCGERTTETQPEPIEPDAGTVTFTSADIAGSAFAGPDPEDGNYAGVVDFEASFVGGEKGLFKASGGEIPAFEQGLDMPIALLLTQPAISLGGSQLIPRDSDLTLSWQRGTAGVTLLVQGYSDRPNGLPGTTNVSCSFPSELGTGVIPSSALQLLEAGTTLSAYTARQAEVTAGDYKVTLLTAFGVYNEAKEQRITLIAQ